MNSWVLIATVAGIVAVAASVVGILTLTVAMRSGAAIQAEERAIAKARAKAEVERAIVVQVAAQVERRRQVSTPEQTGTERPDAPPEPYPERPISREDAERLAQDLRRLARTIELRAGVRASPSEEDSPEVATNQPRSRT